MMPKKATRDERIALLAKTTDPNLITRFVELSKAHRMGASRRELATALMSGQIDANAMTAARERGDRIPQFSARKDKTVYMGETQAYLTLKSWRIWIATGTDEETREEVRQASVDRFEGMARTSLEMVEENRRAAREDQTASPPACMATAISAQKEVAKLQGAYPTEKFAIDVDATLRPAPPELPDELKGKSHSELRKYADELTRIRREAEAVKRLEEG